MPKAWCKCVVRELRYCSTWGFFTVSNASYQTVGSNLKDLILGCDLNPRDFIVE
ncbi:hypothetical protein [Helicobacter pylori]|uniref:hypothetical protein n=1 Tax=Helicobacter pylori TaxID=210 RepID=UPI003860210D